MAGGATNPPDGWTVPTGKWGTDVYQDSTFTLNANTSVKFVSTNTRLLGPMTPLSLLYANNTTFSGTAYRIRTYLYQPSSGTQDVLNQVEYTLYAADQVTVVSAGSVFSNNVFGANIITFDQWNEFSVVTTIPVTAQFIQFVYVAGATSYTSGTWWAGIDLIQVTPSFHFTSVSTSIASGGTFTSISFPAPAAAGIANEVVLSQDPSTGNLNRVNLIKAGRWIYNITITVNTAFTAAANFQVRIFATNTAAPVTVPTSFRIYPQPLVTNGDYTFSTDEWFPNATILPPQNYARQIQIANNDASARSFTVNWAGYCLP